MAVTIPFMKINKTTAILLVIFCLALILRIIAAYHMHVSTVEMIISIIPLNIISAGRLGTLDQAPLYFYLTDLSYTLFGGITPLSLRLTNIVFGALSVVVIFMLAKELFHNRKVGLIAAFVAALSGFSISYNYVMDTLSFFFALLSLFFFVKFIKGSNQSLYFSILFLALGILVSPYIIIFMPIYAIIWYLIWLHKKSLFGSWTGNHALRQSVFTLVLRTLIFMVILLSPIFIYNYFTYTKLGISDVYFTEKFSLGNGNYGGTVNIPWDIKGLTSLSTFKDIFNFDAIILLFGVLGIFLSLRKQQFANMVLLPSLILYYLYMAGEDGRPTFYIWVPLLLSIYAGYGILYFHEFVKKKITFRHSLSLLLIITVILSGFIIKDIVQQREKSITLALRDYARNTIPDNAVIVTDPQIYPAITTWAFNDKHYLAGTQFLTLLNNGGNIPGERIEAPLYYIECGPGTRCGWRVEDFNNLNRTGEEVSRFFQSAAKKTVEIKALDTITVYQTAIEIPSGLYDIIDQSHSFLYYPVGWQNLALSIDNYELTTFFDKTLNIIGLALLYVAVLCAVFSIPFVFYLVFRNREETVDTKN